MHNKNTIQQALHKAACIAIMAAATITASATGNDAQHHATPQNTTTQRQRTDTIRQPQVATEMHDMHTRMMTTPQPVSIKQQGRLLRVESQAAQLLPIYKQNGIFYTAFRLTKGTNWLSGLPRGRYIINNRHFAIN